MLIHAAFFSTLKKKNMGNSANPKFFRNALFWESVEPVSPGTLGKIRSGRTTKPQEKHHTGNADPMTVEIMGG